MKLFYRVVGLLSIAFIVVLTIWAGLFYFAIIDEVNDEIDDSLEDYSELIIIRHLAGENLPSKSTGSNNQYFLQKIDSVYASKHSHIVYQDSMVYIAEKKETEPARILNTIFRDKDNQYYLLSVSTPTIEKSDLIESILYWILFLYGLLLCTLLATNIGVFYHSMKPFYRLLDWLNHYSLGKTNKPLINPTNIFEFKKLNESVIKNTSNNEMIYEKQKQFIGNASHEIQTPIAICQNRIEMLMDDDSLQEHHLEELSKVYQTLEYISKLNKSLLLISRIENGQYPDSSDILINDLVRKYLPDYIEVFRHKNIKVSIDDQSELYLHMDLNLATILITNLLKNAFVHNIHGGEITVSITNQKFTIANSGDEVPLDENKIFERFYQGSKKSNSTGLGLAIVHTICKLYSYQIHYKYQKNEHYFCLSTCNSE